MYGILAMQDLLSRLQLRHFRLVRAVSETGQLSLAAELLAMTQPAASRALAEVERLLGQRLFARHPKGMTPTPEGEVLARHAAELLGGLDLAAEEIASFRQGRSGRARVGAVTGAALEYVMPSVRALKAQAPEAEIRVDVAPSTELMAGLMNGELDFVLCRVPPGTDPRRLEILRGRVEHLSFLVRHGHPLAQVVAVPLSALEPYSFIMQAPGMPIREAVDQAHVAAGLRPPRDVVDTASVLMVIAYLGSSNAVSPAAREVADLLRQTSGGGIAALDMKDALTLSPYHLIRRRGRQLTPLAQRLIDLVLDRLRA